MRGPKRIRGGSARGREQGVYPRTGRGTRPRRRTRCTAVEEGEDPGAKSTGTRPRTKVMSPPSTKARHRGAQNEGGDDERGPRKGTGNTTEKGNEEHVKVGNEVWGRGRGRGAHRGRGRELGEHTRGWARGAPPRTKSHSGRGPNITAKDERKATERAEVHHRGRR